MKDQEPQVGGSPGPERKNVCLGGGKAAKGAGKVIGQDMAGWGGGQGAGRVSLPGRGGDQSIWRAL